MEKVVLTTFEGPLDLLLHLIREHKIDIYDIPIYEITKQYLEYLNKMNEYNIEVASEFLVIASTLINIKVKMLLPKENEDELKEDEDPRLELVNRLIEYEKYKKAAEVLAEVFSGQEKNYFRIKDEKLYSDLSKNINPLENITILDIFNIMEYILTRLKESKLPPYEIKSKKITIGEKIRELLEILNKNEAIYFEDIVKLKNRSEIVISFLAILDLYKQEKIDLFQTDNFSTLKISKLKGDKNVI